MTDPHPHRRHIEEAIVDAKQSPKWIPCDDIAVDAAFLIIRQIERRRNGVFGLAQGEALYKIVDAMCFASGFDSGRRRLYQLVIMAYYRIIKARKAESDELRGLRRTNKPRPLTRTS